VVEISLQQWTQKDLAMYDARASELEKLLTNGEVLRADIEEELCKVTRLRREAIAHLNTTMEVVMQWVRGVMDRVETSMTDVPRIVLLSARSLQKLMYDLI
jgi:hypothetical protein